MLTRCPQCFAWFRVRVEHLSVANGLVTCGRCEHVFNALTSLIEETAAAQASPPPRIEVPAAPPMPRESAVSNTTVVPVLPSAAAATATPLTFVTITATPSLAPPRPTAATATITTVATAYSVAPASGAEEPAQIAEPSTSGERHEVSFDIGPVATQADALDISDFDFSTDDDDDEVRRLSAEPIDAVADDDTTTPQAVSEVPAVLRDELAALVAAPGPARWRSIAWALFGLSLALLALLQGVFIERQRVVAELPAAAPLIDRLCERLPCLERREAASAVRLLARDVREHPTYRDALLVNATIVNAAHTASPYPVIDLRLRDAAGNVLSARRFEPREYLDQSIAIAEGMPFDRPVYIVLELAGNASNAVSFEFTFL